MDSITGTYPEPTALSGDTFAPVTAAISDRGTIRLEQRGVRMHLTPGELRALVALVGNR